MSGVTRNDAVPWYLIAKQALRGVSIDSLAIRFHVSADEIRRQLDKAIMLDQTGTPRIRNSAEINQASARARNDLVTILQEAIDELVVSQQPRLSQLGEFEKLLGSAARLFQWPTVTAQRMVATVQTSAQGYAIAPNGQPTGAVNLTLTATSPEQLAILSHAQPQEESKQ